MGGNSGDIAITTGQRSSITFDEPRHEIDGNVLLNSDKTAMRSTGGASFFAKIFDKLITLFLGTPEERAERAFKKAEKQFENSFASLTRKLVDGKSSDGSLSRSIAAMHDALEKMNGNRPLSEEQTFEKLKGSWHVVNANVENRLESMKARSFETRSGAMQIVAKENLERSFHMEAAWEGKVDRDESPLYHDISVAQARIENTMNALRKLVKGTDIID